MRQATREEMVEAGVYKPPGGRAVRIGSTTRMFLGKLVSDDNGATWWVLEDDKKNV